jgi:hypothetical protein|nr:hypothetical protein [Kofleriaceae bacterium]
MERVLVWGAMFVVGAACGTRANPAANCTGDGQCSDPAFPFCDVDGSVDGTPGACISVDCQPGAVAECRGSDALTCNASGNNFDPIACDFGCDPTAGCLACQAGQVTCANGAVVTCDGSGSATMVACPLGCFADQPRCTDIDPSNGLATFLDMVASPPDLHITSAATLDATTGELSMNGSDITVPTFLVPPVSDDLGMRVLVVGDFTVDDSFSFTGGGSDGHGPAVAIVAAGAIAINAPVSGFGASLVSCAGGAGFDEGGRPDHATASGGGGNATAGGASGALTNYSLNPAVGGETHGTPEIEPLVGGCDAGGILASADPFTYVGSFGGGALQLSSRVSITVSSKIGLQGSTGYIDQEQNNNNDADDIVSGGGAGGSLLLEAPSVTLKAGADVEAGGGDGGSLCVTPNFHCGGGGKGATSAASAAGNGTSLTFVNNDVTDDYFTGGGGGGLGRIRINTPTGSITFPDQPTLVGDLTQGMLRTR